MSEAVSLKTQAEEKTVNLTRTRTRQKTEETHSIQENTFYKIILQPEIEPETKIEQVAEALSFTNDKTIDRARIKEFKAFKEYLQSVSETLSKERIQMTDTGVFAELQRTYKDFNDDLDRFTELINPLVETTDALHRLRINGETRSALAQIKADREWEAEMQSKQANIESSILSIKSHITRLENEILKFSLDRSFFGFGKVKAASLEKITTNTNIIQTLNNDLEAKKLELNEHKSSIIERTESRPHSQELNKLRELLDLTSDEHIKRQADSVQAALTFINQGKDRFRAICGHLDGMVDQIEKLGDNNENMIQIFAMMNEASKKAEAINQVKREASLAIPEPDSLILQLKLKEERQNLDEHINVILNTTVDTMQAYGELSTEAIKIRGMQSATEKQMESARAMHSRGIANVASQLSVTLTAVNSAGINETQAAANNTLTEMARQTNKVAQVEAIRVATGRDEINDDLTDLLDRLASFGDVQKQATNITREALKEMRLNIAEIESLASEVQKDTKDFVAVAAEVVANNPKTEVTPSPFKF